MASQEVVSEGGAAPTGSTIEPDHDAAAFAKIFGAEALAAPAEHATEQPKPEAQASATAESEGTAWDGRDKAVTLLSTYGRVPLSVLEKTPDAVLQEWSAGYREAEAKTKSELQRRSEEAKQLRDELGRFKSVKQEAADSAEPTGPTATSDLEAELKQIADELRENGIPVGDKLAAVIKKNQIAQSAKVEGLSAVNRQLANEMLDFFIDQSRSTLAAQYPQLSNDETFARVREELDAELGTGRYSNLSMRQAISSALNKSARVVLFDDIVKSRVEAVQSNHRERLAGQPTAPTRQPQAKAMTPEERDSHIAALLVAGKTEEARQVARG